MGISAASVHLQIDAHVAPAVRAAVIAALRQQAIAGGFAEVTDPDEPADRAIAVTPAGPEPWLAVFDSHLNDEDTRDERLHTLTSLLSTLRPGPALGIAVYDGHSTHLLLAGAGAIVDRYASNPYVPYGLTRRQRRQRRGQPAVWRDLLHGGATLAALTALWRNPPSIFTEEIVTGLAPLLGLHPEWPLMGIDEALDADAAGLTVLRFRSTASAPVMPAPLLRPATTSPDVFAVGDGPEHVTALVVLGAERAVIAAVVADLIERWVASDPFVARASLYLWLAPDPSSAPQASQQPGRAFQTTRRWRQVRAALPTAELLSGTLRGWQSGFCFDARTTVDRPPQSDPTRLPQLAVWDDLTDLTADERAAVLARLTHLVDEAMARAAGLQGLIAPWFGAPRAGIERTPFEESHQLVGRRLTSRDWCSRYLRDVRDCLWLGPELLRHVGDLTAVQQIATVTPIGDGCRLVLRPPHRLIELERALAPIIPQRSVG